MRSLTSTILALFNSSYYFPVGERIDAMSSNGSVCLPTRAIFAKFLRMLPMTVIQLSSGGIAICYLFPVLRMTYHVCTQCPEMGEAKEAYAQSDS